MNRKRPILLALSLAVWLAAVGAGVGILQRYSTTAGVAGTPGARWPTASHISPSPAYFTLVMAIHPHCPCSRASIDELAILMTRSRGRMKAFVVFVEPPGFTDSWTKSYLWASAGEIPGVTRLIDRGTEATLLNAATSGQTMVYDRRGNLIFSGGITVARGHLGDNSGLTSIAALIDTRSSFGLQRVLDLHSSGTEGVRTPVYGCPLFAPSTRKRGQLKCKK